MGTITFGQNALNKKAKGRIISLFKNLSMESDLLLYLMILMVTTFIVINTIMHDKKINRIEGAALICFFIAFIVQLGNIYSLFTVDTSSNENILFPDF